MTSAISENLSFQYNLDYFSGAQAQIYIGGVLLDEVTTLQWNEHQSKVPLYGYASQYFDEIARGAVIVQGQFSINFVEPNYLYSVLQALTVNSTHKAQNKQDLLGKLRNVLNNHEEPASGNSDSLHEAVKKIDNRHDSNLIFGYMNDTIWGPSKEEKTPSGKGRVDHIEVNGFDIKIKYQLEGAGRPQCSQTIENVHILGGSKALVIDEQPIQEVYSFYARRTTSS